MGGTPVSTDDHWLDLADEAGQLREAMATRPQIDLAKGIIMGARRCSADAAFAELKRMSSHHNIKVVTLSEALVRHVERPAQFAPDVSNGARPAGPAAPVDVVVAAWLRELGAPGGP